MKKILQSQNGFIKVWQALAVLFFIGIALGILYSTQSFKLTTKPNGVNLVSAISPTQPPKPTPTVDMIICSDNKKIYKDLDEAFKNPKAVCYLELSNQNLATRSGDLDKFTRLQTLDISGNTLTKLPPEIGSLYQLKMFSAYNNQLTELPKEIGNLKNLVNLSLYNNKLTKIPPEIGNLTELTMISLSDNQLTELPKEIAKLTNLKDLYLTNNKFSDEEQKKIEKLLPDTKIRFK